VSSFKKKKGKNEVDDVVRFLRSLLASPKKTGREKRGKPRMEPRPSNKKKKKEKKEMTPGAVHGFSLSLKWR